MQHLAVQEFQGTQRLVLRGGGDFLIHGQVSEKGFHFCATHVLGVALVVKQDKAFDPVRVGLFGADRIMLESHHVAHLVEQFLG